MMTCLIAALFVVLRLASFMKDGLAENTAPRVINGTAATPGQFPFMVHIRGIADMYSCSAALITSRKVLTAAHCYKNFTRPCPNCSKGICMAGDIYKFQNSHSARARESRVAISLVLHPYYVQYKIPFDFAIVTVLKSFTISESISTVALVNYDLKDGEACFSIGFGLQNDKSSRIPDLAFFQTKVFKKGCSSNTICTASPYQATYYGDSGGPLIGGTSNPVIHGVLHGFVNQDSPKKGGIHASVYANRDWIRMNMEQTIKRSGEGRAFKDFTVSFVSFIIFRLKEIIYL